MRARTFNEYLLYANVIETGRGRLRLTVSEKSAFRIAARLFLETVRPRRLAADAASFPREIAASAARKFSTLANPRGHFSPAKVPRGYETAEGTAHKSRLRC